MYRVYRPRGLYLEALISKVALFVCMSVCHINYKLLQNCQYLTECPSFAFGTDGAHDPSVLASPLGPMAHAVTFFLDLTKEDS